MLFFFMVNIYNQLFLAYYSGYMSINDKVGYNRGQEHTDAF